MADPEAPPEDEDAIAGRRLATERPYCSAELGPIGVLSSCSTGAAGGRGWRWSPWLRSGDLGDAPRPLAPELEQLVGELPLDARGRAWRWEKKKKREGEQLQQLLCTLGPLYRRWG